MKMIDLKMMSMMRMIIMITLHNFVFLFYEGAMGSKIPSPAGSKRGGEK
jgi:hypothetical protein